MAKLVVNTGSMFSGKSTELLRQGERHLLAGRNVVFLKSAIDNRYQAGKINTHSGKSYECIKVDINQSVLIPEILIADIVLIDEIQFFKDTVLNDIKALLKMGKDVYVSGLDMDANGEPWSTTTYLMGIAHTVQKFQAVCKGCGADAYISAKLDKESKQRIDVGAEGKYVPLCMDCYNRFRGE